MNKRQEVSEELKKLLYDNGAALAGYADLTDIVPEGMAYGVSVGINIPPEIVRSIHNGPNMDYFNVYHTLNAKLDSLVTLGAEYLTVKGYKAYPQTTGNTKDDEDFRTWLPHKTVAVEAGLGWIGKSALLVTKQYGSAIRISSLITNAELECGSSVTMPGCGSCMLCTNACPGGAITGRNWSPGAEREELFNPHACYKKARELAKKSIDKNITLCGKCIEVCPYTQNYMLRNSLMTL